MNAPTKPGSTVTATARALARVGEILAGEPEKKALRISVEGGGCSGFSYSFDLVDTIEDDDFVIEGGENGKIVIDEISLVYMGGSSVDFVDDLMGQSFQIQNPNAVASCGCGTSFSV